LEHQDYLTEISDYDRAFVTRYLTLMKRMKWAPKFPNGCHFGTCEHLLIG